MGREAGPGARRQGPRAWLALVVLGGLLGVGALATLKHTRPIVIAISGGGPAPPTLVASREGVGEVLPTGEAVVARVWRACPRCAPGVRGSHRWSEEDWDLGLRVFDIVMDANGGAPDGCPHRSDVQLEHLPGTHEMARLPARLVTTFVLHADGVVRLEADPADDGYEGRMREAVADAARPYWEPPEELTRSPWERPLKAMLGLGALLTLAGLVLSAGDALRPRRASARSPSLLGADADLQPGQRCPSCRDGLTSRDRVVRCDRCATVSHEDCARTHGGCTSRGCARAPRERRRERA